MVFQWFAAHCLYARIPDCFDCAPAEGNFMQGAAGDFVISRSRKRDRGAFFASTVPALRDGLKFLILQLYLLRISLFRA